MSGVVVLGAGVAGTGAALAAMRAGANVTLVDGGSGASTLWTGAAHADADVSHDVAALASTLGITLEPSKLVTTAGYVCVAQGHDAAALNLLAAREENARIAVVACERPGWDAALIARALGGNATAVDVSILRHTDETRAPDVDFAALHDDDERFAWLVQRLAATLSAGTYDAVLLPSCLGIAKSRARDLTTRLGVPCGEAIGLPGGAPGLRFETARDRALAHATGVVTRATSVERTNDGWRVHLEEGHAIAARAVVMAIGGLVGGGIEYAPSDVELASVLPPEARAPFRLTIDAPAALAAHGRRIGVPGSLFGVAPEALAWPFSPDPVLSHVGVLTSPDGKVAPGLYAAGEAAADLPRTWLASLESGMKAGVAAAREAVTGTSARPASLSEAPASRP